MQVQGRSFLKTQIIMRKLQKITMKDIVNPLNDPEMKAVRGGYYGGSGYYGGDPGYGGSGGGGTFRCFCGMGPVEPEEGDPFFNVSADDMTDAVIQVSDRCPNGIGGCFYP